MEGPAFEAFAHFEELEELNKLNDANASNESAESDYRDDGYIEALLADEDNVGSTWAEPPRPYPYPYKAIRGLLYYEKKDSKGKITNRLIADFLIWGVSQTIIDDGIDVQLMIYVEGVHSSGRILPQIEVPLTALKDPTTYLCPQWGGECGVEIGNPEHIRRVVQATLVPFSCPRIRKFAQTGWHNVDEKFHYLMPGNGNIQVVLPEKISGYYMEDTWKYSDLKTALNILQCKFAPEAIVMPLMAMVALAPLVEWFQRAKCTPKFLLFLVGRSGTMKSTLAALFLSFYGTFESTALPMSFRDTANSIVYSSFALKDTLTVIDDYHPASRGEGKT